MIYEHFNRTFWKKIKIVGIEQIKKRSKEIQGSISQEIMTVDNEVFYDLL